MTSLVYAIPSEDMVISGTFKVDLAPQQDAVAPAGRVIIFKEYSGGIIGTGQGQMISKRIQGGESVYCAIEEFKGTIDGKKGSFTLLHTGSMSSTAKDLQIVIMKGSGSGDLAGIEGELAISKIANTHHYKLEYYLPL